MAGQPLKDRRPKREGSRWSWGVLPELGGLPGARGVPSTSRGGPGLLKKKISDRRATTIRSTFCASKFAGKGKNAGPWEDVPLGPATSKGPNEGSDTL